MRFYRYALVGKYICVNVWLDYSLLYKELLIWPGQNCDNINIFMCIYKWKLSHLSQESLPCSCCHEGSTAAKLARLILYASVHWSRIVNFFFYIFKADFR